MTKIHLNKYSGYYLLKDYALSISDVCIRPILIGYVSMYKTLFVLLADTTVNHLLPIWMVARHFEQSLKRTRDHRHGKLLVLPLGYCCCNIIILSYTSILYNINDKMFIYAHNFEIALPTIVPNKHDSP